MLPHPVTKLKTWYFQTTCHLKLEDWHLIRMVTSTPVSDAGCPCNKAGKDPSTTEWKVFATGLHNPMGMELIGPGHIVVTQMAEFTEIIDTDQDGVADRYNNLASDFGISGITMKPMPYALMVKEGFTSPWVRHRTMAPLSLLPGRILQGGPARQKFFIQ